VSGADAERGTAREWVGTLASTIGILVALLYYFGWVRTTVQMRDLGSDPGVLDLSTQDYVLKSVNVLFVPAVIIGVACLAAVREHERFVRLLQQRPALADALTRPNRFWRIVAIAVAVLVVLLVAPVTRQVAVPLSLALALGTWLYVERLRWRLGRRPAAAPRRTLVVVVVVLLLATIWLTERLARAAGHLYAEDLLTNPAQLPAVTLTLTQPAVPDPPGVLVMVSRHGDQEIYQYQGLRLLQASANRYVFLCVDPGTGQHRVLVIRDSDGVQVQLG
jgi:hypothetical protein